VRVAAIVLVKPKVPKGGETGKVNLGIAEGEIMKSVFGKSLGTVGVAACVMLAGVGVSHAITGTASTPISLGLVVTPYIIAGANPGGNRTCAEAGVALAGNAEYYSCRSGRINYSDGSFEGTFVDVSGNEDCEDNVIQVWVTDGTHVAFHAAPDGIGAAIVKGSADANVYFYVPQATADSGLAAPPTASGEPAGLSNLTFCWNPTGFEEDECFEGETAWADGTRYLNRGNWATYTSYAGGEKTVTLFAGQTLNAGTVKFEPSNGEVKITVTLATGWRFALNPEGEDEFGDTIYDDNLKVQDYESAPVGINPEPGLFDHKKFVEGTVGEIIVPLNNFYGVHADVEQEVECPF
jgi:hypothetical protein